MFNTKKILNRLMTFSLMVSVGFVALLYGASPALAATRSSLGAAESFGVLGGRAVTSTGWDSPRRRYRRLARSRDHRLSAGERDTTGKPTRAGRSRLASSRLISPLHITMSVQACDCDLTGKDLGGITLTPGVYVFIGRLS